MSTPTPHITANVVPFLYRLCGALNVERDMRVDYDELFKMCFPDFIPGTSTPDSAPAPASGEGPYRVAYAFITESPDLPWPESGDDALTPEQERAVNDLAARIAAATAPPARSPC